jgi:hypothetical protein
MNLGTGLDDDNDLVQMVGKCWRKVISCISYLNCKDCVACVLSCVNVLMYLCVCVLNDVLSFLRSCDHAS